MGIKNKKDFSKGVRVLGELEAFLDKVKGTGYERSLEFEETLALRNMLAEKLKKLT